MSYFSDASLVYIPAAVKNGKTYSVKPTDGSGDLTFTRASNATRVGPDGLIHKVRENLLLQSNTFSTTWTNSNSTDTGGQAGYDGTNNAWLLTATSAGGFIYQDATIAGLTTFSIYAKAGSEIGITLYSAHASQGRYFNLSTGALAGAFVGTPLDSKIESIGSGWYRCSITVSATATNNFRVYVSNGTANVTGNIYIQNAQLEVGDIATQYLATTTAPVSTGPVSGVPRLDYLNSSCPRLLLEGQRTNVITNYNDFVTGASNVTTTANNSTSPEGYQNADLITGDAGTATKVVNFNGASAGQYTISVFAKYNTQQWIQLGAGGIATYANFDIQNGAVGGTNGTATITDYGNGWYRCSLLMASATPLSHYVGIVTASGSVRLSTTASTGSFWAYGYQSELGTYATSIIPTYGTSVTRVKSTLSKTSISSLIGQTEGTIFMDFIAQTSSLQSHLFLSGAGEIGIYGGGSFTCYSSGGCSINAGTFVAGQRYKLAFAYKLNDYVAYVNGVQKGTDTSATVPATSNLYVNSYSDFTEVEKKEINQLLLFKTRLTNAQLAELTTL